MTAHPIFIHSSFRAGNTWLFNKFQQQTAYSCYYSVFNDHLTTLKAEFAAKPLGEEWRLRVKGIFPSRVPYGPFLLPEGGVKGFAQTGDEAIIYLNNLINHAHSHAKTAVFSTNQSLADIVTLKKSLPSTHILMIRNLIFQWKSYLEFSLNGNSYFIDALLAYLEANQSNPVIAFIHHLPEDEAGKVTENTFYKFIFLHLYLYAQALKQVDAVIYNDDLKEEAGRKRAASILHSHGITLDLSDYKPDMRIIHIMDIKNLVLFERHVNLFFATLEVNEFTPILARIKDDLITRIMEDYTKQKQYIHFISRNMSSIG